MGCRPWRNWLLGLLIWTVLLADARPGLSESSTSATSARVVRHLAAVHAAPGPEHALVWRLYEGTQVEASEESRGSDGSAWRRIRLWNSQDGWLEADAISFDPYPPPPPPTTHGGGGACAGATPTISAEEQRLAGPAEAVAWTALHETPDGGEVVGEVAAGENVLAEAWTIGADGRARYRVTGTGLTGWATPGAVVMQAADPLTRQVDGRPIVAPLSGVGMWFVPDSREYGVAAAVKVAEAARANGLSHLYVEVGTSTGGFWGARWLDELLPAARTAGVRVIGSVYACLNNVANDLALSLEVARYRTSDGLALDGLTADVEETLVAENVQAYGELLRHHLGDDYLMVATTYPPESWFAPRYPWPALARSWNAVAPMAYWRQMESRAFTASEVYAYTQRNVAKVRTLAGRPDLPVEMLGQLFEMGRPLLLGPDPPTAGEVEAAAVAARDAGAVGISFFDWTRATPAHWQTLANFQW
jgi:hypothetical protein